MNNFNILFTSVGRRVALILHFKKLLNSLGLTGSIVTTDIKKNAPAAFIADFQEQVPHAIDPSYIAILQNICKKYQIKLLVPLIDPELHILSLHKQDFDAIGVTLLISSNETNEICFDKRNTYNFFKK